MPHHILLHSIVDIHATYIVRQLGASAAQAAYILPPPTTIVGAFMNPIARILDLSEEVNSRRYGPAGSRAMWCALRSTLTASAGIKSGSTGIALHAESSRIIGAPYKSGGSYQRALKKPPYKAAEELLPVQAVGYASAPSTKMHLVWLVDVEALSKCVGREVDLKILEKAAWNVYRLGSREGIVSTIEASVYREDGLELIQEGSRFTSILYQPEECVDPGEPLPKVILYDLKYSEASYIVVALGGSEVLEPRHEPALFTLRSGCMAVRIKSMPELTSSYMPKRWGV